jgi:hypothetical protein
MALYIFGDSFGEKWDGVNTWTAQLSTALNVELKNYAVGGSSLEYTYKNFYDLNDTLTADDIVIMVLTDLSRKWLLKNEPGRSSLSMIETSHKKDTTLVNAVQLYYSHFFNLTVERTHLTSFIHAFSHLTNHLKFKPLILVAFDDNDYVQGGLNVKDIQKMHPNTAEGSLWKISTNEFSPKVLNTNKLTNFQDFRPNHLSRINHTTLANKIMKNIQNNLPVDLTTEFMMDLYTTYKENHSDYRDNT